MTTIRNIQKISKSVPTVEGAGVRLKRGFGFNEVPQFDPFLLLDDFHSENPDDYIAGFPWHPHRGIETVTYILKGKVEHGDSIGNKGVIGSGDVQWMSAGGGIIHQEMPVQTAEGVQGFQLWVNLPSSDKMMPPRYRDVKADSIPKTTLDSGVTVKTISGSTYTNEAPVRDVVVDIEYLDITVPPSTNFKHTIKSDWNCFAYTIEGSAIFKKDEALIQPEHVILFGSGDTVSVATDSSPVRFLLIAGQPINEPVAWGGPIVMNTREELQLAFEQYQNGTFLQS